MTASRWLAFALALAGAGVLGACGSVPASTATLSPGAAACRVASLTNPAAASPGLGGTGAPAGAQGPDPGGIGGTGQVATGNGLGGTGAPAVTASAPSGLGGTGSPVSVAAEPGLGGTGIVGVVTGFASICVNGVEVAYEPSTPVQRDGQAGRLSELSVGQVVALQASGQGDQLQARRIEVLDAAVGPLTALDAGRARFEVMGQRATALEPADLAGLAVGDWVRVSGQRLSSGEIRATRVQRAEAGGAWISGLYLDDGPQGPRIGDTPLTPGVAAPLAGRDVEVGARGRWVGGRLSVQEWRVQPARSAVAGTRDVLLQGYVHGLRGRELRLGYDSVTLGEQVRVEGGELRALRVDQPVLVRGRMDDQRRVTVDKLEFRQEGRRGADRSQPAADPATPGTPGVGAPAAVGDDGSGRSGSGRSGSDDGGRGRGRGRGGDGGSSGSGSSGSGSSGSGSSGSGSSGSGSSGSGSSGSGSSGSGSSGSGSSGSGSSGSGSSGSGSSGSGSSGGDSDGGRGRGRGRGRGG